MIFNILAAASATNLLVESKPGFWLRGKISKIFRNQSIDELMSCAMCSGFWIGLILNLMAFGTLSIGIACITSIASELINQKLNKSI